MLIWWQAEEARTVLVRYGSCLLPLVELVSVRVPVPQARPGQAKGEQGDAT